MTKEKLQGELEKYNNELNSELDLEKNYTDLVDLNLTGRFITSHYIQGREGMEAIKNIDKNLLLELQKQASQHSSKPNLTIMDDKPTKHEDFKDLEGNPEYDDLPGVHSYSDMRKHKTVVSIENVNKDNQEIDHVTLHEIGHAIDDLVFEGISITDIELEKIYRAEKDFFPDDNGYFSHIKSKASEFFAECFAYYYSKDQRRKEILAEYLPKTYEFIEKLKNELPSSD